MVEKLHADHIAAQGGSFEPQRRYNWRLEIPSPRALVNELVPGLLPSLPEIFTLSLESFSAPTEESELIEIPWVNESKYMAGVVHWEEPTLVLKDWVEPDVAALLKVWRQRAYNPNNGRVAPPIEYQVDAFLLLFGPDGDNERTWILEGFWPRRVIFGELDYKASESNKITAIMRYNRAVYLKAGEVPGLLDAQGYGTSINP